MKQYRAPLIIALVLLAATIFWFLGSPEGNKYLEESATDTPATPVAYSANETTDKAVESTSSTKSAAKKRTSNNRITEAPAKHEDRRTASLKSNTPAAKNSTAKTAKPATQDRTTRSSERTIVNHPHFTAKAIRNTRPAKPPTGNYWIGVNGEITEAVVPIAIGAPYSDGQVKDFARINSGPLGLTTDVIKRDFFEQKAGAYYLKCRVNRNVAEFATRTR